MSQDQASHEPGKISSTRAYTGRVISLDVDEVRFPDGSTGKLEMVRHPGASAVVPLLDENNESGLNSSDPMVLLIRQYRYAADGYMYEVPAGRLDAGESPAECAHRELAEETGYRAVGMDLLLTMYTTPGFTDEKIHLFVASGLTLGESARESDEFLELKPTRMSEALRMIERGDIQDAKTALALMLTNTRIKSRATVMKNENIDAQLKAARAIANIAIETATTERGAHAETAISAAARMAGTLLFRTFGLPTSGMTPGSMVLSDFANERGPVLLEVMQEGLKGLGVTLNGSTVSAVPDDNVPHLTIVEMQQRMDARIAQVAATNGLVGEDAARACALAAAILIDMTKSVLDPAIGFAVAAYGFVEGTKTVPLPIT